jgi:hypothetical protein
LKFKEERRLQLKRRNLKVEEMADVRGWNAKGQRLIILR